MGGAAPRRRVVVDAATTCFVAAAAVLLQTTAAVPVASFDELALGIDFSTEGYDLGTLPVGRTRVSGRVGSAADPADTVAFWVAPPYVLTCLDLVDYEELTPVPTLATPAPTATTPAPSSSTPAPTLETPAPTVGGTGQFFLFISDEPEGFIPDETNVPAIFDKMLGGRLVGADDVGPQLPILANATTDFDGSTRPEDPLGRGFDIPLPADRYIVEVFDGGAFSDFASYAFELCVEMMGAP